MTKFDSIVAETLYAETPDDSTGTVDGGTWYGWYPHCGVVLTEDNYGFVTTFGEVTQEEWDDLCERVDTPEFPDDV